MQLRMADTPVPCISTASSSPGARPAEPVAATTTACWLGPCGAVRLLLRPSWLTAVPASSRAVACPLMPLPPAAAQAAADCSMMTTAASART